MRLLVCGLVLCACGIPERVHTQSVLDLEKCQQDLANTRTDYMIAQGDLESERGKRDEGGGAGAAAEAAATKPELEAVRKLREAQNRRRTQEQRLAEDVKTLVDAKTISVDGASGMMALRMTPGTLFDVGKAEIKPEARPVLASLAGALKDIDDRDFLVVGHADPAPPPAGRFKSNWEFSTARAIAVVQALQREGVDPRRLGALGRSEFEGGAARIEILMMPTPAELP